MNTMTMTREEMETRRTEAFVRFDAGDKPPAICRSLNVSRATACRWRKTWAAGRSAARTLASGRPSLMSAEQFEQVRLWYIERKRAGKKTTADMVAAHVQETFGVKYSADHLTKIMKTWWAEARTSTDAGATAGAVSHTEQRASA